MRAISPDPAALIVAGAPRRVADLLLDPLFILGKGQPKVADLPRHRGGPAPGWI